MRVAVLADEITATGWHLAGASVHVPQQSEADEVLARTIPQADLLLITADVATWLRPRALADALDGTQPLALVIEPLRGGAQPADIGQYVRRALGVDA